MKLTCYKLGLDLPEIRPAPMQREWMDNTPSKFAYRCLPLNIANMAGWEILCPVNFTARWNGGDSLDAISVEVEGPRAEAPVSHFGSGILTFHVNAIFQTEPGYNLYITGPVNAPKHGIQALTGIIETDWSPYSFTMNWKFTHENTEVRFERGEPFCFFFPVVRNLNESVEPVVRNLKDDPELYQQHVAWSRSRREFINRLRKNEEPSLWQKNYFQGKEPSGKPAEISDHQIKLKLRPFTE